MNACQMRILSSEGTAAIPAGGSFCSLDRQQSKRACLCTDPFSNVLFEISHETKTRWRGHSQIDLKNKVHRTGEDSREFILSLSLEVEKQSKKKSVHSAALHPTTDAMMPRVTTKVRHAHLPSLRTIRRTIDTSHHAARIETSARDNFLE